MGSFVFLVCLLAQLLAWDLQFKLRTLFNYPATRRYIDRNAPLMARRLFAIARLYGGLQIEVSSGSDRPLPPQALIVANHQSLVDIPLLMMVLQNHALRFVAKRELRRWVPASSHVLRVQRHALIDRRSDFRATMDQLRRLGRRAAEGISPVVFPEGTRSRTGEVRPFSAGAVRRLLEEYPLPVIAVALDGGYRISHLNELPRRLRSTCYRVRIMAVYDNPQSKNDVTEILGDAHRRIREQVESWQAADRRTRLPAKPKALTSLPSREDSC